MVLENLLYRHVPADSEMVCAVTAACTCISAAVRNTIVGFIAKRQLMLHI